MTTPRIVRTFKDRFAPLVEAGTKLQTVRLTPKRMPKPGWLIDCRAWTGLPYRSKQRQLRVAEITAVRRIKISAKRGITIDGYRLSASQMEDFAVADGFANLAALLAWFRAQHALPFKGIVTFWKP